MEDRTVVEEHPPAPTSPARPPAAPEGIHPPLMEEVETSIGKEGISYLFESRSISAVLRFVYTPIDGTFADIELEINNADPIKPAEEGGILVEMGGRLHAADSEEVERHFISCEQVGDCVEARWQWILDKEQANFLYRFRIRGKSLVVEIEGGNGKATGLDLGRVAGALHPRLIAVPYFNFGENYPRFLCTSGLFLSSFVDWHYTRSSSLFAPAEETARKELRLNGGCTYMPRTDGRRNALQERWIITASTQFDETFPRMDLPAQGRPDGLAGRAWYNIPYLEAAEESYVESYEQLRMLKQMGLDQLLVNHPADTWHDGDNNSTYTLDAAAAKGGDDALSEYLDAVSELGYLTSLQVNFRDMSALHPEWTPAMGALLPDGSPVVSGTGHYLVKPAQALQQAGEHVRALLEKYQPHMPYVAAHAAVPPWDFSDCDAALEGAATLRQSYGLQRQLLAGINEGGSAIGDGGNHWFYAGLLDGYVARMAGSDPSALPPLVDFDLRTLHPLQSDAGLGTIDQYFGGAIAPGDKHSRSPYLIRYLAATLAFGHAVLLPDPVEWGMAATIKAYFMLQKLQAQYLRTAVESIHYHHEGNFLTSNDALLSGAYERGQIRVAYQNGTLIHANLGQEEWQIELDERTYVLPAGGFVARGGDGLLSYSADAGSGHIDYVHCDEFTFVDTRERALELGPLALDGAALVKERKWEIDVVPMDCRQAPVIHIARYWPGRRLPPLRLLAYKTDGDEPDVYRADMEGDKVRLPQIEDVYMYRITLPEWMVEPGR